RATAAGLDARGAGAPFGTARRGRLPRLRLEGQDAAPPPDDAPQDDRRAVSAALEPAERPPADRADIFGAALGPRQGAGARPRQPDPVREGSPPPGERL